MVRSGRHAHPQHVSDVAHAELLAASKRMKELESGLVRQGPEDDPSFLQLVVFRQSGPEAGHDGLVEARNVAASRRADGCYIIRPHVRTLGPERSAVNLRRAWTGLWAGPLAPPFARLQPCLAGLLSPESST